MKKLLLLFVSLSVFAFTACSDDDDNSSIDFRDKYVGEWKSNIIGAITYSYDGGEILTSTILDTTYITKIKKNGTDKLVINDKIFNVIGTNKLTIEPSDLTEQEEGIIVSGKESITGTLSGDAITLNSVFSGTWKSDTSEVGTITGNIIGSVTNTLVKM
ncbi:hypothetical protein [Aquimarina macrocephali]|uniref:hypothetical protein n=1 Tax=Aquimarina macrocephali TaxID=666563 RepID=UPI0004ADD048|nr:hypothetical protein [Aquimarina macrocephali]